jgi:hypothetical protein
VDGRLRPHGSTPMGRPNFALTARRGGDMQSTFSGRPARVRTVAAQAGHAPRSLSADTAGLTARGVGLL